MKRIDFEHGTVTGNILGAALPMLVAQILSLLYNIVDRVYIARIPEVGTAALGAVGLCFPLIVIITAFSNLFGSGGAPLFSIERGKNDQKKAERIMNTSYSMVCVCAVILMVIGFLFARPLLSLFGASADAMVYAYPYMMIYLIGTLPSMVATGMNPFINAQGYSTVGMLSVTIGAVANLLLDPLFIFVFGFGVQGAAIATVISQTLSAVFVLYFLTRKSELKVRFVRKDEISECAGYAKNIVSLGTAGFIMQLTNSVVTICCNNVLSVTGGDVYISVMTIISSVRQMVETPIYAITEGSSPIISYNYGAGNSNRVRRAYRLLLICSVCYAMLFCLLIQLFPGVFAAIFTSNAELLAFTKPMLRIYTLALGLFGIQIACQMTFTALGNAKASIIVAVMRKFILLLPLIYMMPHLYTADLTKAVFMAEPVADVLAVAFTGVLFFFEFRKALRAMPKSEKKS